MVAVFLRRLPTSCPATTITTATTNIAVPMTLICTGVPRCAEPQTNMGKVTVEPALKLVMMKSSKESAKASSAPAAMPGGAIGQGDPQEGLRGPRVEVLRGLLQARVHAT